MNMTRKKLNENIDNLLFDNILGKYLEIYIYWKNYLKIKSVVYI